jgi:hypothetical protein
MSVPERVLLKPSTVEAIAGYVLEKLSHAYDRENLTAKGLISWKKCKLADLLCMPRTIWTERLETAKRIFSAIPEGEDDLAGLIVKTKEASTATTDERRIALEKIRGEHSWRISLPPIVEKYSDGALYVTDGRHRLFAAHASGKSHVKCLQIDLTTSSIQRPDASVEDAMKAVKLSELESVADASGDYAKLRRTKGFREIGPLLIDKLRFRTFDEARAYVDAFERRAEKKTVIRAEERVVGIMSAHELDRVVVVIEFDTKKYVLATYTAYSQDEKVDANFHAYLTLPFIKRAMTSSSAGAPITASAHLIGGDLNPLMQRFLAHIGMELNPEELKHVTADPHVVYFTRPAVGTGSVRLFCIRTWHISPSVFDERPTFKTEIADPYALKRFYFLPVDDLVQGKTEYWGRQLAPEIDEYVKKLVNESGLPGAVKLSGHDFYRDMPCLIGIFDVSRSGSGSRDQQENASASKPTAQSDFWQTLLKNFMVFLNKVGCFMYRYTGDGFVFALSYETETKISIMRVVLSAYRAMIESLFDPNNVRRLSLVLPGSRFVVGFTDSENPVRFGRLAGPESIAADFQSQMFVSLARLDEDGLKAVTKLSSAPKGGHWIGADSADKAACLGVNARTWRSVDGSELAFHDGEREYDFTDKEGTTKKLKYWMLEDAPLRSGKQS